MKSLQKSILIAMLALFGLSNVANAQTRSTDTNDDTSFKKSKGSVSPIKKDALEKVNTMGILPVITFNESPYNHNMHIASDGNYLYTINGGNTSNGQINKFSLSGALIQTYPIQIDGRGLSYNNADGFLYASVYGGDIVKITNLSTGTYSVLFLGIMQNSQASFAISTDGSKFFDFSQGTLKIHNFNTGTVINTISGFSFGAGNYGGEAAVAVDSSHIYTWDATTKTVYAYNQSGAFIQATVLDSGDNGQSLSIANGYLFVSKDANYSVGTWYGYNISGLTFIPELENDFKLNIFPNPTTGKIIINGGKINSIEIYNCLGEKAYSSQINSDKVEIDLSKQPKGIYFYQVQSDKKILKTGKIIVE